MSAMTGRDLTRRNFLASTGSASLLGLAGCIESRDNTNEDNTGDGGGGGGPLTGQIGIAGSSTVYPLTRAMRVEFLNRYPQVDISVQSTGTGGGFGNFFCTGDRVINDASRQIQQSEREQCRENGITPLELRVATDALTVVVSNDADWIDCVTTEELAQIWGANGVEKWSEVREDWPEKKVELYGPATTSGTFDYFTEEILGEERSHREDYQPTEDDNTIVTGVKNSNVAMGYLGFAHYNGNKESVKAVSIEDSEGDGGCVSPSLKTAANGEYTPLARPLFIYVNQEALAKDPVAEFCRFYINNADSEELVADSVGYVPLTEDQQALQRGRLELAIEEGSDA